MINNKDKEILRRIKNPRCEWCGKLLNPFEPHRECNKKLEELWDYRVKNKLCLDCGEPLTDQDTDDKNERKSCNKCWNTIWKNKKENIKFQLKEIGCLKKNPLEEFSNNKIKQFWEDTLDDGR